MAVYKTVFEWVKYTHGPGRGLPPELDSELHKSFKNQLPTSKFLFEPKVYDTLKEWFRLAELYHIGIQANDEDSKSHATNLLKKLEDMDQLFMNEMKLSYQNLQNTD